MTGSGRYPLFSAQHRQRGLSMIELMVAVTLSLIMLGGVLALFISSKRGYAVQDASGRLQESARFATTVLDEGIRMADYWGGIGNSRDVALSAKITTMQGGSTGCNPLVADSSSTITSGIVGYAGGTYSSLPAAIQACIGNTNNYVPNTDVMLLRYADPEPNDMISDATLTACTSASCQYYTWPFVRYQTGYAGWVFLGQEFSGSMPTNLVNGGSDPIFNSPYIVQLFYVRPCAVQANGTSCQKTDDGGQPRPTLVEAQFINGTMVSQAIIDGVEMMKLVYGVDSGGTKKASQFQQAGSVANWEQVISVQYSLVVRADAGNSATPDVKSYQLVDYPISGSAYTPSGVTLTLDTVPDQNYLRRVYSATVQLRNRVRY